MGNLIPAIKMNINHTILVDTRWKQRFRLTKEDDLNTDCENNGVSVSEFFRFTENVNYTMTKVDNTLAIEYLSGKSDHFSPIWSVILFLIGFQMLSSGKIFNLGACNIFYRLELWDRILFEEEVRFNRKSKLRTEI